MSSSLMHVSGRGRGITELDLSTVFATEEERSALTLVRSLDLSYNELSHIAALQPLSCLMVLNVSHNRVVSLSGLPLSLTRIDVSFNSLTSLEGLKGLPCLEELDISHNKIMSLSSLGRIAPHLKVLKATGNQISATDGLEQCSKLRVLMLDHNLLQSADDLYFIASLMELEVIAVAGCPVSSINGYRAFIAKQQKSLLTIDGAPVPTRDTSLEESLKQRPQPQPQQQRISSGSYSQQQRGDHSVVQISHSTKSATAESKGTGRSVTRGQQPALETSVRAEKGMKKSQPPLLQHSTIHIGDTNDAEELTSVKATRAATRQLQDTLILLEQEQRESARLRHSHKQLEHQLSEARRVMRDQLEELTLLRDERAAHVQTIGTLKLKLEKAQRNLQYQAENHHSEIFRLVEEFERERAIKDVHISDLRQRMTDEQSCVQALHNESSERMTQVKARHQRQHAHQREVHSHLNNSKAAAAPMSPDDGGDQQNSGIVRNVDETDSSDAAAALAQQLKVWLEAEVAKKRTNTSGAHGESHHTERVSPEVSSASDENETQRKRHHNRHGGGHHHGSSPQRVHRSAVAPASGQQQQPHANSHHVRAARNIARLWQQNEKAIRSSSR